MPKILKEEVCAWLEKNPCVKNADIYAAFKYAPKASLRQIHNQWLKKPAKKPKSDQTRSPKSTSKFDAVNEALWEACLLRLINEADEMTPSIIDKIRDFLDKKQRITTGAAADQTTVVWEELLHVGRQRSPKAEPVSQDSAME
jgi:hypothetical protein